MVGFLKKLLGREAKKSGKKGIEKMVEKTMDNLDKDKDKNILSTEDIDSI